MVGSLEEGKAYWSHDGESFLGKEHLNQILKEAQTIVSEILLSAIPSDFP
ncbi:MAG: hypothetical protein WCF19_02120 [Chlamydiales bacterium]